MSEVEQVMFYEQVRFNTDLFRFEYDRDGKARMSAPVIAVFD